MGRSKLPKWKEPEKLLLIRRWRRRGLTVNQVAKNIGIGNSTLLRWSSIDLDIREALKSGKEEAVAAVENKLFVKALSGNLTAIIFYLKNNDREHYSDSKLSPEEVKQVRIKTKKMAADARIAEARADALEKLTNASDKKLDVILDKMAEEVQDDDAEEHSDKETNSGS